MVHLESMGLGHGCLALGNYIGFRISSPEEGDSTLRLFLSAPARRPMQGRPALVCVPWPLSKPPHRKGIMVYGEASEKHS